MTFDSCLINIQPTETVFKAALILPGHQTREQQSCTEPALQEIKQWDLQITLWPNFSSLLLPDNPPSLEPISPFPRGGDENWTWMSMAATPPGSQEEELGGLSASILRDRVLQHRGQLLPDSVRLSPSAPRTASSTAYLQSPAFLSQTQMDVNDLAVLLEVLGG